MEWSRVLPSGERLRHLTSPATWGAVSAFAVLCIALAAWIPVTARYFALRPWPALAAYAGAVSADMWVRYLSFDRRELTALCELFGSFLLQLSCVLLMVGSSPLGAALFSSWLFVVAGAHGHFTRSGARFPFLSASILAAAAVGLALAPTRQHWVLIGIAGIGSSALAMLIGEATLRADRARDEQVARWTHDMRNALTEVACSAKLLTDPSARGETGTAAESLKRSLGVVAAGLDDVRRLSEFPDAESSPQLVPLFPVAESVVSASRARFAQVEIELEVPDRQVTATVLGGAVSVHRILDNLVVNACEGDGVRAARRVTVSIREAPDAVRLEVSDDGPGFPQHLLHGALPSPSTTKRQGTGRGLQSVEQLVAANRGRATRANQPQGGAIVTVELPVQVTSRA